MPSILSEPDITKLSDEELEKALAGLNIPTELKALAVSELTRRRIRETKNIIKNLKDSIQIFDLESSKQATTMIRLTWTIAVLTVFMLIAIAIQIFRISI